MIVSSLVAAFVVLLPTASIANPESCQALLQNNKEILDDTKEDMAILSKFQMAYKPEVAICESAKSMSKRSLKEFLNLQKLFDRFTGDIKRAEAHYNKCTNINIPNCKYLPPISEVEFKKFVLELKESNQREARVNAVEFASLNKIIL